LLVNIRNEFLERCFMRKLRLVGTYTMACGFCFSDICASSSGALLGEAETIINCGVEGLRQQWSPEAVESFKDSASQCRKKLQDSSLFEKDEQLILMEGELASLEEIVQNLDIFATTPSEEKKQYLKMVAYHSDSRVRSLILSRLNQIGEAQSENERQTEKGRNEVDRENIPPTVSAPSKASPKAVKGKHSKKARKK
jgi:hypothetical protein